MHFAIKIKGIIYAMFFLLGVTSTITLLRVPTPIKVITAHNLVLYLTVFILLTIKLNKIKIKKISYFVYMITILISTFMTFLYPIAADWTRVALINTVNHVFFYSILFIYIQNDVNSVMKRYYINGLKVSILLQLFWEIMQIISWYAFDKNLNQELFSSLKVLSNIKLTQSDIYGNYRFTGLGWQSSNLAIALLLGYILFNNKYIRFACIIGIIASTSRVGVVSLVIIILYQIIFVKKRLRIIRNKKDIILVALFGSLGVCFLTTQIDIMQGIVHSLSNMAKRFTDISWDLHFLYYLWIPEILSKMPYLNILFGYGLGCSGYAYSHYKDVYVNSGPWIPENDFCSSLFGIGVIGLLAQYVWYLYSMHKRKKNSKDYMVLLMIFFAGFMYAYINSWVLVVAMFCMTGNYIDFCNNDLLLDR